MKVLIAHVQSILKTIAPSYLEEAPPGQAYPYIVYRFPQSSDDEGREDFLLEVTVWDKSPDNEPIEDLTDQIDRALNRTKHIDSDLQTSLYRISRQMIPDPDPSVRRRELRFVCKTYLTN